MVKIPNPPKNFLHSTSDQWEILKPLARQMRYEPTQAERTVWEVLRNRNINEAKFRRQYTIDKFIVDFICLSHSLIIEIDGDVHLYTIEEDQARQSFLESLGFRVVRFRNEEVFADLARVVRVIGDNLTPQLPSP